MFVKKYKVLIRQHADIIKYLLTGGLSFLVDIAIFIAVRSMTDDSILIPQTVAVVVATIFNFSLNYLWVFRSNSHKIAAFTQYIIVAFMNYLLATGIVLTLSDFMNDIIAKCVSIATIACWNYIIYKTRIFTKK